jgi:Flp pilus assembly protein TadG
MRGILRRKLAGLGGCSSGNATLIVALGMPMLLGGAGLGVDMAQWYMWKRELQFAVDQAAIAGAWARTDVATQNTYKTRARQEFVANLAAVEDFATLSDADIDTADYNGGTANSVTVEASATHSLPFSTLVTGRSATIGAFAQAVIEGGQTFTACMLAVDPDDDDAFIVGGSASGTAACGFGALSDDDEAMRKNGQSDIQAGYLVSSGGIDRGLANNGTLYSNVEGLQDPYADLDPPDAPVSQTYICPPEKPASIVTTANVTINTTYEYDYVSGKKFDDATPYNYAEAQDDDEVNEYFERKVVEEDATEGTYESSPVVTEKVVENLGKGVSVWEVRTATVTTTYEDVQTEVDEGSDGIARLEPGTYESIEIACETRFAPGVYVVEGNLDFGQSNGINNKVTGTDMMFVLEGAGALHINSNSYINLSGITATTLMTYGVSADDAAKLAGMLIFDPESDDRMLINGNATLKLEGVMYMPNRTVEWKGNSTASGKCIMLAAGKIELSGNNNLTNFCVPAGLEGIQIGGAQLTVKLVA